MSLQISVLPPSSEADQADRALPPRRAGVAPVVGVARGAGFTSLDETAMGACAEHRSTEPACLRPEVYCLKRGGEYALQGLAPCTDLGCRGCTAALQAGGDPSPPWLES
jgi:hypothetical protein